MGGSFVRSTRRTRQICRGGVCRKVVCSVFVLFRGGCGFCAASPLRHPGLVPGSTVRLGGTLEPLGFRWRHGGPRNRSGVTEEEDGFTRRRKDTKKSGFARRRGGRGGKSQGYCWRGVSARAPRSASIGSTRKAPKEYRLVTIRLNTGVATSLA
jgi:hypothetical protein